MLYIYIYIDAQGAGRYDIVLGADVVYPKTGLPASLAAAALSSLKRNAEARLYIMQHGSYMKGVSGAAQDKEGRSFHTRCVASPALPCLALAACVVLPCLPACMFCLSSWVAGWLGGWLAGWLAGCEARASPHATQDSTATAVGTVAMNTNHVHSFRDGWKEFTELLGAEGIVTTEPFGAKDGIFF